MAVDPEDKNYKCLLDEKSLEKAIRELHEDPKERLSAVHTLRAWIKYQPHFTCRNESDDKRSIVEKTLIYFVNRATDTDYLLQILRTAKFSQLRARELLETILTMRTKCPEYMVNLDSHEPGILRFIEKGMTILLPKVDSEGRTILLFRAAMLDMSDPLMSVANEMRSSLATQELIKERNENMSVNGVLLIMDMTGMTARMLTRMSPETHKKTTKIFQECNVGRMKGFHFYNCGGFFEMMAAIMKPLLKKKYSERLYVHETMESLYKVVPQELWPDEYLPDDYTGPSAGPIKGLTENLVQRLKDPAFRTRLLDYTSDRYKIDESKRISDVPQASFRKLNVD